MPNPSPAASQGCEKYNSLYVHRFTEICEHLFGASTACLLLVEVARLAANQFLVLVCHGTAADPVAVLVNVNMIEFRHG